MWLAVCLMAFSLILEPVYAQCGRDEGEADCGAGFIDTLNPSCDSNIPVFQAVFPPETICGTSGVWEEIGSVGRDTDWFEYVATQPEFLTVEVIADFHVELSILNGNIPCIDGPPVLSRSTTGNSGTFTVTEPIQPGVYWIFIAPFAAQDSGVCPASYTATFTTQPFSPAIPASEVSPGVEARVVANWDGHPSEHAAADVWGDDRGYAYVGDRQGNTVDIMDIRDPANPTLLTTYTAFGAANSGAIAKDVKVHDRIMYVALDDDGGSGVQIVDVRDPCA